MRPIFAALAVALNGLRGGGVSPQRELPYNGRVGLAKVANDQT
jgi:hypothetical protein